VLLIATATQRRHRKRDYTNVRLWGRRPIEAGIAALAQSA
jgi:hypothetical protein